MKADIPPLPPKQNTCPLSAGDEQIVPEVIVDLQISGHDEIQSTAEDNSGDLPPPQTHTPFESTFMLLTFAGETTSMVYEMDAVETITDQTAEKKEGEHQPPLYYYYSYFFGVININVQSLLYFDSCRKFRHRGRNSWST